MLQTMSALGRTALAPHLHRTWLTMAHIWHRRGGSMFQVRKDVERGSRTGFFVRWGNGQAPSESRTLSSVHGPIRWQAWKKFLWFYQTSTILLRDWTCEFADEVDVKLLLRSPRFSRVVGPQDSSRNGRRGGTGCPSVRITVDGLAAVGAWQVLTDVSGAQGQL